MPQAPEAVSGPIEQWDRYWAYGYVHSLDQSGNANYAGAVARFWSDRFAALDDGSRVLDIATGNGAVAMLALDAADRLSRRFEVAGVDRAAIAPVEQVHDEALRAKLARIRFHPSTAAESLPCGDGEADMVCSQFGLEYSDLSRSSGEIARAMAPGGRLALILHHADSTLLQATQRELSQLEFVLDEVKLYLKARNALRAMAEARGNNKKLKADRKRRAVKDAIAELERAAERADDARLLLGPPRYIREIFAMSERKPAAELLEWFGEAHQRVLANQRRLRDMAAAARSEADMRALGARLSGHGVSGIEWAPFQREDGATLGWRLTGVRGA